MLIGACKPQTPKQFIQPGEMEDILVDYHLAMAMANETGERNYYQHYYMESVLREHGVTQADFDSSMVFYYTHAERFRTIYAHVSERLEERALSLGATEGEIGKYAALNAEGDTANIWADRNMLLMRPQPPYNRFDFMVPVDSTFKRGDSFLVQFMSDYLYQEGTKAGMFYLAIEYTDTTVMRHTNFGYSGLIQMRVAANDTADVKGVRGFFYLGGAAEQTTTQRLLFINHIQFIRFHKENVSEEVAPEKESAEKDAPAKEASEDPAREESAKGKDTPKEKAHEEKPASSVGERDKDAELPAAEVERR